MTAPAEPDPQDRQPGQNLSGQHPSGQPSPGLHPRGAGPTAAVQEEIIRAALQSVERLPLLETVIERCAQGLGPALRAELGAQVEVTVGSIGYMACGAALDRAPDPGLVALVDARPWAGALAATLDAELLFAALEIMLGGPGDAEPAAAGAPARAAGDGTAPGEAGGAAGAAADGAAGPSTAAPDAPGGAAPDAPGGAGGDDAAGGGRAVTAGSRPGATALANAGAAFGAARPKGFTRIEKRLGQRLVELALRELATAFAPLGAVAFAVGTVESGTRDLRLAAATAACVRVSLRITLDGRGGELGLILPHATLDPVRRLLAQPPGGQFDRDAGWRPLLSQSLREAPVTLTAVLHEPVLPLAEVLGWRPGQVLDLGIDGGQEVTVKCSGRAMFRAAIGRRRNGSVALRITAALGDGPGRDGPARDGPLRDGPARDDAEAHADQEEIADGTAD